MNDFQRAMFIFFEEWGGTATFQAEHNELYFHGVDVDELASRRIDCELMNELFDLGWRLTEEGESFVSYRWGSC